MFNIADMGLWGVDMDFVLGSLLVCGICILMLAPEQCSPERSEEDNEQ